MFDIKAYLNRLIKTGFFSVFTSTFLSKVVNFAYGIILVRIISKAEYGVYSYANNTYSYFNILLGLGIGSAILQVCCEDKDDLEQKRTHFNFGFSFSIYFNLLLSASVALFGLFVPLSINGSNRLLLIMGLLPAFTQFTIVYSNWLRANYQNNKYAILNIANVLLVASLSIAGALIYGSVGLIVGRYIAEICTLIVILILRCPIPKPMSFSKMAKVPGCKRMLYIAITLCVSEALIQVIALIGTSVLGAFTPDEEIVASYKTATTIPLALAFISNAVMIYAYPYFVRYKEDPRWTKKHFKILMLVLLLICSVISTALVLFAEPLITLVFGKNYLDSVGPFRILMISFFFNAVFRIPCINLIISQVKLKFSMFLSVFGAVLTVCLNVVLVLNYQSIGAAIAQSIVMLVTGIMALCYYIFIIHKKEKALTDNSEIEPK